MRHAPWLPAGAAGYTRRRRRGRPSLVAQPAPVPLMMSSPPINGEPRHNTTTHITTNGIRRATQQRCATRMCSDSNAVTLRVHYHTIHSMLNVPPLLLVRLLLLLCWWWRRRLLLLLLLLLFVLWQQHGSFPQPESRAPLRQCSCRGTCVARRIHGERGNVAELAGRVGWIPSSDRKRTRPLTIPIPSTTATTVVMTTRRTNASHSSALATLTPSGA